MLAFILANFRQNYNLGFRARDWVFIFILHGPQGQVFVCPSAGSSEDDHNFQVPRLERICLRDRGKEITETVYGVVHMHQTRIKE